MKGKTMRGLLFTALAAPLVLAGGVSARAQGPYPGAAPYVVYPPGVVAVPRPYPYAFRNESPFSINNSYLGYVNFVDDSGHPPAPGYVTPYGQAVNRGFVPAPTRGGVHWFGRRRGYRY